MTADDTIAGVPVDAVPPPEGDGRHLSIFRVLLVIAVVVAAAIGGTASLAGAHRVVTGAR